MGADKEKQIKHSQKMQGKKAWNKGQKGLQPWMNTTGLNGKGSTPWNKGLPAPRWMGENNPNWAGGVTSINEKIRKSIEYKTWRLEVLKRDNYLCVECGIGGWGNIQADHIKPFSKYPELRFDLDNGRTLCIECHRKTPTWGMRNRVAVA